MVLERSKVGGWAEGVKITFGELNAVDAQIEGALDKRSGQEDTLASAIEVSSSGSVHFLSGSSLALSSGSQIDGATAGTIAIDFESGSEITFESGTQCNLDGYTDVTGDFQLSGNGNVRWRQGTLSDASQTIHAHTADSWRVPNTVSVNRTITLANPPSMDGLRVRFSRVNPDPDFTVALKRSDTTLLATFPVVDGGWVELEADLGVWRVSAWGGAIVINEGSD